MTEVKSVCRRYQNDHGGWLTRLTGIPVMLIGMLMSALVSFSFSSVRRIMWLQQKGKKNSAVPFHGNGGRLGF